MTAAPLMERFLANVQTSSDCWTWRGHRNLKGYGEFGKRGQLAHRLSWQLFKPEPLGNLLVCHACDNPSCVRPSHLFLGTPMQNTHDALKKGRLTGRRGESNGSAKLTMEKVKTIRTLYANGEMSYATLGKMFGVNATTIQGVVKRVIWSHIKEEQNG